MSTLHVPDPDDRGDLGTFVGRVVVRQVPVALPSLPGPASPGAGLTQGAA